MLSPVRLFGELGGYIVGSCLWKMWGAGSETWLSVSVWLK